jgi:hypothetical protein
MLLAFAIVEKQCLPVYYGFCVPDLSEQTSNAAKGNV